MSGSGGLCSESVEHEYVHSIYSRLATYQQKDTKSSSPRVWPRVRQFVEQQPAGSIILDIGCGEAKYTSTRCHVIGFDTCPEVLTASQKANIDLALADAMKIPVKDDSVDAILNVSVIHHLSSVQRRKRALQECARSLRIGGQMMIYTWAFEQPNGKFTSQDILVPWNLHETSIGGRLPKIKFHVNSTKEQRIIASSIPITILNENNNNNNNNNNNGHNQPTTSTNRWFSGVLNRVTSLTEQLPYFSRKFMNSPGNSNSNLNMNSPSSMCSTPSNKQELPSAAPQFLPITNSIISGIKRWSPMLGRRLATLLVPVEEQYGEELAQTIMTESITEAMATLREVTFYRYYHVFKEGELRDLVDSIEDLRVISTTFEHGNWCVIAEKMPQNYMRV